MDHGRGASGVPAVIFHAVFSVPRRRVSVISVVETLRESPALRKFAAASFRCGRSIPPRNTRKRTSCGTEMADERELRVPQPQNPRHRSRRTGISGPNGRLAHLSRKTPVLKISVHGSWTGRQRGAIGHLSSCLLCPAKAGFRDFRGGNPTGIARAPQVRRRKFRLRGEGR